MSYVFVMTQGRSEEVAFEEKKEAMALEASVTRYDDVKITTQPLGWSHEVI